MNTHAIGIETVFNETAATIYGDVPEPVAGLELFKTALAEFLIQSGRSDLVPQNLRDISSRKKELESVYAAHGGRARFLEEYHRAFAQAYASVPITQPVGMLHTLERR